MTDSLPVTRRSTLKGLVGSVLATLGLSSGAAGETESISLVRHRWQLPDGPRPMADAKTWYLWTLHDRIDAERITVAPMGDGEGTMLTTAELEAGESPTFAKRTLERVTDQFVRREYRGGP